MHRQLSCIGLGKTTLANEICLKWAKDKEHFLSNDYDFVILIQLRTIQERTLEEVIINDAIGSKMAFDELVIKSNGKKCLIILEGLDEISAQWQENDKMFCQLVKNTVFLSHATILVTSRPHACIDLHKDIKKHVRRIEIVGFDKPQIKEYAELHLNNSNTAEKFMDQVNNNPHISSLCYVPVCLNMVLDCFKYNKEILHTTLTELYQSLIISKVDVKKPIPLGTIPESDENCYRNLATVLSGVPNVLSNEALETMFLLSKLAYKSYFEWNEKHKSPKIIYTTANLAHCSITKLKSDACGLLKATNTLFATGNTTVFTFNHLSVQEYFCALYISLLPEDQQLQLLKDHMTVYPHMWPFYAGITKLRSSGVLDYLQQVLLENDNLLDKQRLVKFKYSPILYHIHQGFTVLNNVFEAKLSSDVCKWNVLSLFLNGHGLLPYDCMSILYFMSIAPITLLFLNKCHIGNQGAEILARDKGLLPSLKLLDLSYNNVTDEGMESIVAFVRRCTNLTHLSIAGNPVSDDGIQLFSLLKFKNFVQLNIRSIEMTEAGTSLLGKCFKLNNSLQSLDMSDNEIKDSGITIILSNLPSTLVQLIVSDCQLTYNGAVSIAEMLRVNKTLKHLKISKNSIEDDGISAISDSLHVNTTLIELVANCCNFHSKGAESIAEMLQTNKTLKYLNISYNHIGDDGISAIILSVQYNTALIKLDISGCNFHSKSAKSIDEMLLVNKTLKFLNININKIGDNEISAIAHGIQGNTTLVKLFISGDFHHENTDKLINNTLQLNRSKCDKGKVYAIYSGGKMDAEEWLINDDGDDDDKVMLQMFLDMIRR